MYVMLAGKGDWDYQLPIYGEGMLRDDFGTLEV